MTTFSLTTAQVIYAAESRLLELADIVSGSSSFTRVKNEVKVAEALIRYIRTLQSDTTLTHDEQVAICQHMINIGDLYDFAGSPSITSDPIYSFSIGSNVGPQGPQGLPGKDGGGTDFHAFAATSTVYVDEFTITDADGAEWSYRVKNGVNLRVGRVIGGWLGDGSQVVFSEYSTMDIGDTSDVSFVVEYSGGKIKLQAVISSGTWDISGTRYYVPNNGAGVVVGNTVLPNSKIWIGNASNQATPQSISGDLTINSLGVAAIGNGVIVNGDISASAAIGLNKLALLAPSRAVITNGSGILAASAVTSTEIGYLSGVTSGIQAQLDSKLSGSTGAISTVTAANLATHRVVISDGAGKIAASSVGTTSLGYISNLTSDAQTQLNNAQSLISGLQTQVNGKVAKTGDIITGTLEVQGGLRTENTGPYLKKKIVEIGDWNMDANPSKDVAHGLGSSYKKIRSISVMVRDDTDTNIYPLERTTQGVSWPGIVSGLVRYVDSTYVYLIRLDASDGGWFDGTPFDSTSYNRGWVTIEYEA